MAWRIEIFIERGSHRIRACRARHQLLFGQVKKIGTSLRKAYWLKRRLCWKIKLNLIEKVLVSILSSKLLQTTLVLEKIIINANEFVHTILWILIRNSKKLVFILEYNIFMFFMTDNDNLLTYVVQSSTFVIVSTKFYILTGFLNPAFDF